MLLVTIKISKIISVSKTEIIAYKQISTNYIPMLKLNPQFSTQYKKAERLSVQIICQEMGNRRKQGTVCHPCSVIRFYIARTGKKC